MNTQMLVHIGLHCMQKTMNLFHFDNFGIEHIPADILDFIENKDIITNIFRIQAYSSIMCGYFCILFIDFMLTGKKLAGFTYLFSPYDFRKTDDIVLSYFK